MLFKYFQQQLPNGQTKSLPCVLVTFKNKKNKIPVVALIDSGADFSILPIEVAGILGIKLNPKEKIEMNAAGGSTFDVYPSPQPIECIFEQKGFRSIVLRSKVYFTGVAPTILIGHDSLLFQLRVTLDGVRKEVKIE